MPTTTPPMIMTNTPSVEGREIVEHCDIVGTESCIRPDLKSDEQGGLIKIAATTRQNAIDGVRNGALKIGADAVVGLSLTYTYMGVSESGDPILMVVALGTAVKLA